MKLPNGRTMLGDRMLSVTYRKGQKHACDPACRAAGHVYRHTYKKPIPLMAGGRKEVRVPARLFTRRDGAIEPYAVDNPPLLIVNGPHTEKRRRKNMATYKMRRDSKGHFVARSNAPRKRKKKTHRKNPPFWTAGALVNSPKHRRKARRKARRNPPTVRTPVFLGIPLVMPEISDVLGITAGLAGPPMVKGFAMQLLPASVTTSTMGKYGIEAGSYILPPVVAFFIGGRRALKNVLTGEAAAVAVRLVGKFTAQISASLPANGVASYMPQGQAAVGAGGLNSYLPAAKRGRMLNAYANSRTSARSASRFTGNSTRR
jgi:hypothetical protein